SPQGTVSLRMSEAYIPVPQGGSSDDRFPEAACPGRRTALSGPALDPFLAGLAGPGCATGDRPLGTAHRSRRGPARSDAPVPVVCLPRVPSRAAGADAQDRLVRDPTRPQ